MAGYGYAMFLRVPEETGGVFVDTCGADGSVVYRAGYMDWHHAMAELAVPFLLTRGPVIVATPRPEPDNSCYSLDPFGPNAPDYSGESDE